MRKFCFALAVALTLVLPGSEASAWDGVQTLNKSRTTFPVVAGNEDGRRVVAWAHPRGVFARVAPRGGRFGPRRKLAAAGLHVRVAVDERGDIAIVWTHFVDADPATEDDDDVATCCVRLVGAVLRRDGRLSRRVQLGVPDAINGEPLLSTDTRGRIAMAWATYNESGSEIAVHARFGTLRGGFGALRQMSPPGEGGLPVSVGRGRVAYGLSRQTVETSHRPGGRLVRRVLLDFPIGREQLGTDHSGRQTGAWENGETVTRTPPGPFETVAQHDAGRLAQVSVAGSGAAAVAWLPGGTTQFATRVVAVLRPPDASFGSPIELDQTEGYQVTLADVDVASDGSAAVAAAHWRHQEPDPVLESRLYLIPADGGAIERLSIPGAEGSGAEVLRDARGTLAVVRGSGGAVARWVR